MHGPFRDICSLSSSSSSDCHMSFGQLSFFSKMSIVSCLRSLYVMQQLSLLIEFMQQPFFLFFAVSMKALTAF